MSEAIDKITYFLKNMKFKKKAFGGVDTQDVLLKFSELDSLYQKACMEKIGVFKSKLTEKEAVLEQKDNELAAIENEKHELNAKITELEAKVAEVDGNDSAALVEDLRKQLTEAQVQVKFLNERIEIMTNERATYIEQIAAAELRVKEAEHKAMTAASERGGANAAVNAELEAERDSLKTQYETLKSRYDTALSECDILKIQHEAAVQRAEIAEQRVYEAIENANQNQNTFYADEYISEQAEREIAQLKLQISDLESQLAAKSKDLGRIYYDEDIVQEILNLKASVMAEAASEKESMLAAARKEANEIVNQANLDKEQIRLKGYFEISRIQKEKQALNMELSHIIEKINNALQDRGFISTPTRNKEQETIDEQAAKMMPQGYQGYQGNATGNMQGGVMQITTEQEDEDSKERKKYELFRKNGTYADAD